MFRATYWISAGLALALLLLDGASGAVLTTTPDRGKVERDKTGTVRGGGGVFIWLGGGYQGGK
jgi:hypothetical protein